MGIGPIIGPAASHLGGRVCSLHQYVHLYKLLDAPPSSRARIFILGHADLMPGSKTSSYIRAIVLYRARHHSIQIWPCLFRWFRLWELEADVYSKSNFNHPALL